MPETSPIDGSVGPVDGSAYEFDPALLSQLAHFVDQACAGAEAYHQVSRLLRAIFERGEFNVSPESVRELSIAFMFVLTPRPLGSSQPGADLGPIEGPGYPRPLREASDQVRELWKGLASAASHPMARARFSDIVFTLRLIKGREYAERAVQGYLDMVGGNLRLDEQCDGLLRAWTIARSVGLSDRVAEMSTVMLNIVEAQISVRDHGYVAVHLLDALVMGQRKKGGDRGDPRIDQVLDSALLAYSETHTISEFAALVRRRATGDEPRLRHAGEVEVQAHLRDADKSSDGIVIRAHLNEAASKARKLGLAHLEATAVSLLQAAPQVEWKTMGFEFGVPRSNFHRFLLPYLRADSWQEALAVWFHSDAPTGTLSRNEEAARVALSESTFTRLATTIVFGRDDLPKRVLSGDDDAYNHQLVRAEMLNARFGGIMLADALDLVKNRFGIPAQEDLGNFLADVGAHPALGKSLSKSLQLFWVGEFEAAVHLSIPKIEAAVRALLLELNEPMYRAAVGDGTGSFPGLGALLDPLVDKGFDPDWARFLRTFLLGEGDNVRNLTAHGFMDNVDREKAALALRACSLVVLIASEEAANRDRELVRGKLANPAPIPPRPWWRRVRHAVWAAHRELTR
ncbi:hypothetical protein [Streptomyces sp. NPDC058664]|uniref:hypothetical protein n=1 Tax=unclassified Streptomyces TaxID=2593676 RepID=UPI003653E5E9